MRRFILVLCLLFLAFPIFAQEETPQEPGSLLQIHYALLAIDDLQARGVLNAEEAEAERAYYLEAAQRLTGEALSREAISERAFESTGSSVLRFLTFVNLLWALASLIIVISVLWLFIIYVVPLLIMIPWFVYEALFYMAAFAFIWNGQFASEGTEQFVALPGVLALGLLLPFSILWRGRHSKSNALLPTLSFIAFLLSLIWGFIAVQYASEMIGFLTILALLASIGLSRIVRTLLSPMVKEENLLIEAMVMCFGLLMIYLFAEVRELVGIYQVFGFAVYWIGSYGYFAALEVMATKWRNRENFRHYLTWQLLAILSGVLGLFIGIFWQVDSLSETAGTFLLIFVLTKYFEIFNWRKYWVWASLGLGILLYIFALLINEFPQFFLLG